MAASLELAISAIRSGRKQEGRQLLNLLIQQNPNDDMAWLWMSSVVDTDEQRARCLYHVLAINPDSEIARRGLQVLGIVVSDSRPVKVPRDSQPIKIPKPSANPQSAPLPLSPPDARPTSAEERRPFRIDPKAIVEELPFTPITPPFSGMLEEETSALPAGEPGPGTPAVPASTPAQPSGQHPSEPVPAVRPDTGSTQPLPQGGQLQHPSEPVPVAQSQSAPGMGAQSPARLQPTGSLTAPDSPQHLPQQPLPAAQQPFNPGAVPHETRPSQPVPVIHSYPTMGMSQQLPYAGGQYRHPSEAVPAIHSNQTMGMPTQYLYPQNYSQPVQAVHSNTTMGMPLQAQPAGPMGNQGQHPSEPVPAVQPNQSYPPLQWPQFMSQSPAIHSNSTMAMPMGYDPFAALRTSPNQEYRMAGGSPSPLKGNKKGEDEQEDGEEINILAVIIFGSLSITALGGLGMLILLMFTTG